jgi:5-methylcytosine-specific restriction endonuclease McrA
MNKIISSLTDQNLITELKNLVQQEREVLAEIIRYLQEVDARRLYLELGYSSLFSFATQALGYSEGSAYRRIKAARVSVETPEVLQRIATGSVSLCAAVELSRVPTQIMRELLPLSEGKAKEEVKQLSNSATRTQAIVSALTAFRKARSPAEREKRREERRITATVKVPAKNRSRHIPDAVRDAVFLRAQGRGTYVGADGHQCGETRGVQLDHIHPFSCGGTHTVDNLRVTCGPHNRYVFERD